MYNENIESNSDALQHVADELAVKNLIESLKYVLYTKDELETIQMAIAAHNLGNAALIIEKCN